MWIERHADRAGGTRREWRRTAVADNRERGLVRARQLPADGRQRRGPGVMHRDRLRRTRRADIACQTHGCVL